MEYKTSCGQFVIDLETGAQMDRDLHYLSGIWSYRNPAARKIFAHQFCVNGPIVCFTYRLMAKDVSATTTLELLTIMGYICLHFLSTAALGVMCCDEESESATGVDVMFEEEWLRGFVTI